MKWACGPLSKNVCEELNIMVVFFQEKGYQSVKGIFKKHARDFDKRNVARTSVPPISLLSEHHFKRGKGKRRWPPSGCSFGDLHDPICEPANWSIKILMTLCKTIERLIR
jgi:hypothetical protein